MERNSHESEGSEMSDSDLLASIKSIVAESLNDWKTDFDRKIDKHREEQREELVSAINGLRTALEHRIGGLRTDLEHQIGGLRTDLEHRVGGLEHQIGELKDQNVDLEHQIGELGDRHKGESMSAMLAQVMLSDTYKDKRVSRRDSFMVTGKTRLGMLAEE